MVRIYSYDTLILINGMTHYIIKTSGEIVDIYGFYVKQKLHQLTFVEKVYTDARGWVDSYTA